MLRKLYFLTLILFILPLLWKGAGSETHAQIYPVQLSTQLIPPYSGYLADYAEPGSEKLRLILQFNDFTVPQYNIRLKLEIRGNGFSMVSKQLFNPPPIIVQPGVPVLISGTDLAPYLSSSNLDFIGINQNQYEQGKSLPEGHYTICVTAFDYYLAGTQVSNEACAQAWFTLSDPPFLNLPLCNTNVTPQTPQNILFQWTPMNMGSPNSAFNTEYDLEIWEIRPDSTLDPNQVALSTAPIFKTTTQQTFVNYGIAEPPLTLYMKYAWRVRARDISGKDLFKNNGYSQVCTFNYGSVGKVLSDAYDLKLTAQGITHRMGICNWNLQNVFNSYLLQVRKQGTANWFDYHTPLNAEKITNLEPKTTYEARVRGEGSDIITGNWSNTATFTTLNEPNYSCNDQTLPANTLQASPLPKEKAIPGMIIQSGQFEVITTEIIPSGGPGWYSGKGYAKVMGGFPLSVKWKNIFIDDNIRQQQGIIEAETKGIDAWMQQWDLEMAESNATYTNGVIDSVYVSNGQVCIILQGNPNAQCYPVPPDANVFVIRDEDGNQYAVTTNPPPAQIQGPTKYLVPSADSLDITDSMKVVFSASATQKFGFDQKEYVAWGPNYEVILTKEKKYYFVPYKSVGENQSDEVLANVTVKGFDKNLLRFKSKDGTVLTHTAETAANQYKVTVPDNVECIYAWYGTKKIGKLNVMRLKALTKKVVFVPVNNATVSAAASDLSNIYKQANVSWTASTAPNFTYDLGADGLETANTTLMSKYSTEMRALRDAYRQQDTAYDKNAYYIFVVPAFSDANQKGYMVRGRAVGFITSNCSAKDLAHELAHGAFGLEHTFPKISQGTTNNLLDYSTGSTLTSLQWTTIHSNLPVFNWLDSEEDGAILDYRVYILETINKIKKAYQYNETIDKKDLPTPVQTNSGFVEIYNVALGGVKYPYIIMKSEGQSIHPKENIVEFHQKYLGNRNDGLIIDGKLNIYVPSNLVPILKQYITTPADRNLLLFVGGYLIDQEIFTKSPDVVYQSDVWDYWGEIGDKFISRITTYNTIYASGSDFITTSNHFTHEKAIKSKASIQTPWPFLNNSPKNPWGFSQRFNNGKKAGIDLVNKLKDGRITCRKTLINGIPKILDTIDIVAHSMGFAYSLGMIEEIQKAGIHVGRFYIIAPENGCSGQLPENIEQAWQYGSDENIDPIKLQDGVAPQCAVNGLDKLGANGGRVRIPEDQDRGWINSHLVKNYGWIFNKTSIQPGYVKPRK